MKSARASHLKKIYLELFSRFGPQHWWPGDTRFEIIVGAILTQNTNWGNVVRAIANLKKAKVLTSSGMHRLSVNKLAALIRPSGYFNIKAKRLKNFLDFLFGQYQGSLDKMGKERLDVLRKNLLSVNGIGPETADSILLYAFNKPIFVVDAYTRRMLSRHGLARGDEDYQDIQTIFMESFRKDGRIFNEYHALIVRLGKEFCKPTPNCGFCPLKDGCSHLPY